MKFLSNKIKEKSCILPETINDKSFEQLQTRKEWLPEFSGLKDK